ncbi:putative pentatricopeptide repeat-containing protein, mitochondrial-like [Capsicum annuum]|nr:putative pentatricopeptide repeat-containing protein, mitochondrial-like [Capsicum annuum]
MVRMNPLHSVVDFSKLFNTMLTMKHYSLVVSLFREMRILGIPIDGFILNIVTNSYCLMHRSDCAFSVLPFYLKSGILFSGVTFTSLIRGLFAENRLKDAVELFKKVARENICEPDQVMYGTVMNGLSKRGHTQKALSLLRLMEHGNTKPDVYKYNIVVDALCKDGNLVAAINLLNEMKQKNILLNIVTYNSLIDGLCKLGQWEKVKTLFSEMVNLNIYPNVNTFTMVIDGLCKEGKVEDAEEVMKHMVEKGVEPNIITYNAIMDGYCLRGQTFLINGYCKKKKVAKAMQLLGEISQRGYKPNTATYNTILQGLFEVRRTGDAKRVYAEMLSAGPKPNICTHSTVLDGYFRYGLVEEAMSLLNKLERKRENTDIAFYRVVINGLCKNGKLDEAHSVFEKLSFIGLPLDIRTYNTMITGFCIHGLLDEAKSMLRKMEDNGCPPNNVTYRVIVQGFLRCSKFSEMETFMKEMADRGFSFDASTAGILVNVVRENPSVLDMIPELHSKNNIRLYVQLESTCLEMLQQALVAITSFSRPTSLVRYGEWDKPWRLYFIGVNRWNIHSRSIYPRDRRAEAFGVSPPVKNWGLTITSQYAFLSCLSLFMVRYSGVLGVEEPHQSIPNLVVKLWGGERGQIASAGMVAVSYVQRISEKVTGGSLEESKEALAIAETGG